jgi:hypothetical protein
MEPRVARRELRGAIGLVWKRVRRVVRKAVQKGVRKAAVRVVVRAVAKAVARVADGGGEKGAIVRGVDARRCLRVAVRVVQMDGQRLARR